jgi:hypothetical protein
MRSDFPLAHGRPLCGEPFQFAIFESEQSARVHGGTDVRDDPGIASTELATRAILAGVSPEARIPAPSRFAPSNTWMKSATPGRACWSTALSAGWNGASLRQLVRGSLNDLELSSSLSVGSKGISSTDSGSVGRTTFAGMQNCPV